MSDLHTRVEALSGRAESNTSTIAQSSSAPAPGHPPEAAPHTVSSGGDVNMESQNSNHADAHPPEASREADDDKDSGYKDLSHAQILDLIQAINNAPNDASEIRRVWESKIPANMSMTYKQLKRILHPDSHADPEEKKNAQNAFQCERLPTGA
ncbi:uncharacterized protein N7529_009500 [Penicillium soppii]|uniref:uncharacterized protein n=1 Tax=Penicillium soppii TaxID=69789 RepID=UPI0025470961|nr:uncharacterized protein N7529_009500 [Penicillium soppii]KAJ5855556.1 hypothetical protein N7529_009500 [Penicillium soppii]